MSSIHEAAIVDALERFSGDVLSLRRHEGIVREIFATAPGEWRLVSGLDLHDAALARLLDGTGQDGASLRVTWLDYPDPSSGYCLIVFFLEGIHWHSVALYNKARLDGAPPGEV